LGLVATLFFLSLSFAQRFLSQCSYKEETRKQQLLLQTRVARERQPALDLKNVTEREWFVFDFSKGLVGCHSQLYRMRLSYSTKPNLL
jgi:hypothetical protein